MNKRFDVFIIASMLCLIGGNVPAYSQLFKNSDLNTASPNKFAIKSNLLAPLEWYNGFNAAVEYSLSPSFSLQHGFNYITNVFTEDLYGSDRLGLRGYRIRNELRYYNSYILGVKNGYLAAEFSLDQVAFDVLRTFSIWDVPSQRTYYKNDYMHQERNGYAFNIKLGRIIRFNKFVFLDTFFGVGMQRFENIDYQIPEGTVQVFKGSDRVTIPETITTLQLSIGCSIGFGLGR